MNNHKKIKNWYDADELSVWGKKQDEIDAGGDPDFVSESDVEFSDFWEKDSFPERFDANGIRIKKATALTS